LRRAWEMSLAALRTLSIDERPSSLSRECRQAL
jgi:hypothetical protein